MVSSTQIEGKVAIVILNYKNYEDTINCIDSIFNSKNSGYTIFVVDNDSGNNSLEHIKKAFDKKTIIEQNIDFTESDVLKADIVLIQSTMNNGYAAGNNLGLKSAYAFGYGYLMVLNNDTLFKDNALDVLRKVLIRDPSALCVGPKLIKSDSTIDFNCAKRRPKLSDFFVLSGFGRRFKSKNWIDNYYYLKKYPNADEPIRVDIISGSCMLFNSRHFAEIDFFDENTFLYFEEAIITEKARKRGFSIWLQPNVSIVHLGAASTKKNTVSNFALQSELKSAMYYLTKYRKLSKISAYFVCLGQRMFLPIRRFKKRK